MAHRVDSLSLSRLDAIGGEADIAPVTERVDPDADDPKRTDLRAVTCLF